MTFSGFDPHQPFTALPEAFFTDLLPQIDDLAELKVCLFAIRLHERQEGPYPYFRRADLVSDSSLMEGLGDTPEARQVAIDAALDRAVGRGVLLRSEAGDGIYMLNSPKGRAALQGLEQGFWSPEAGREIPVVAAPRPNIFQLYERNIGPLTPLLADRLREAEVEYPLDWIEEAIEKALANNVRKWSYVEAILKNWQETRHDGRENRQDSEEERQKYVRGEFSEYIER